MPAFRYSAATWTTFAIACAKLRGQASLAIGHDPGSLEPFVLAVYEAGEHDMTAFAQEADLESFLRDLASVRAG